MTWNQKICAPCRQMNKLASDSRRRAVKRQTATIEVFSARDIFERDQWECQACGKHVRLNVVRFAPARATLDHILPLSKGGLHTRANVRCLCMFCNIRKNNRVLMDQLRLF